MSRLPREIEPGTVYHLISRFVDREWFIRADDERHLYLQLLGRALSLCDWRCIAFAIMSNHIHLSTIAGTQPLDSWIRRVHSPFATAMNRAYDRIGPMFVRGPKALPIDPAGVGSVLAYIHNNPVRAKLVGRASESAWTSHRAYVGVARAPSWLHVEEGLALAGISNPERFDAWVADPERETFESAHERVIAMDAPRAKREHARPEPASLVALAASELGIPLTQLRSRRRGAVELVGREAVVHCGERLGLRGADIARALGITQQAVSSIGHRGADLDAVALGERLLERIVLTGSR